MAHLYFNAPKTWNLMWRLIYKCCYILKPINLTQHLNWRVLKLRTQIYNSDLTPSDYFTHAWVLFPNWTGTGARVREALMKWLPLWHFCLTLCHNTAQRESFLGWAQRGATYACTQHSSTFFLLFRLQRGQSVARRVIGLEPLARKIIHSCLQADIYVYRENWVPNASRGSV